MESLIEYWVPVNDKIINKKKHTHNSENYRRELKCAMSNYEKTHNLSGKRGRIGYMGNTDG